MLSQIEKSELRPTATYIQQLPRALEQWTELRSRLPPGIAFSIESTWPLLGISLNAFYSDIPNPVPGFTLKEEVETLIQSETTKYLSLSLLLFQGEPFIRREAIAQGIDIENLRRSDFVKIWAIEGCICEIVLYLQAHWEGYSQNQWNERKSELLQYTKGEIKEEIWRQRLNRWQREDSNLALGSPRPEACMPFSKFCIDVFKKYREKLPELPHFTELWLDGSFPLKSFIINGEERESRNRKRKKP